MGGRRNNSPPMTNNTEEYDGSSWTSGGNYPTTVFGIGLSGSQTAALGFGASPYSDECYYYDGSSWTTAPSLAQARQFPGGSNMGTQAASIAFGGRIGPAPSASGTATTEEFTGEFEQETASTLTTSL